MEIPTYLLNDIETAADQAYRILVDAAPWYNLGDIHRRPECSMISALLVENLVQLDCRWTVAIRNKNLSYGSQTYGHSYPFLHDPENPNIPELIADPTWQQFASFPRVESGEAPRVLIGESQEVIETARQFGVPTRLTELWLPQDGDLIINR